MNAPRYEGLQKGEGRAMYCFLCFYRREENLYTAAYSMSSSSFMPRGGAFIDDAALARSHTGVIEADVIRRTVRDFVARHQDILTKQRGISAHARLWYSLLELVAGMHISEQE